MEDKVSKNYRIIDMYVRLMEGRVLNKAEEAEKFHVDERSIQRDIDDIRAYLNDRKTADFGDVRGIEYDRVRKGFYMTHIDDSLMSNSEILAVSKILLDSRAFTKKELTAVLDKLIEGCVPRSNAKLVSDLIANEQFHYVELHHKEYIQDKLWMIGSDIYEHQLVELTYMRANVTDKAVKRVVEPVAILFSEYYFYLNAYIVEKTAMGEYVHKYDYPAIFRIDRIQNYKQMKEKFHITYADRFEEGEFRKRIQFMYPGKLMNVRLKYYGENPEPILDRLPTAKILEQKAQSCLIEAQVYGKGIIMWLLSQREWIEVLKPDSLRDEMKEVLLQMLKRYE